MLRAMSDDETEEINAEVRRQFVGQFPITILSESWACMRASEPVLATEWNTPEEDQAWENL